MTPRKDELFRMLSSLEDKTSPLFSAMHSFIKQENEAYKNLRKTNNYSKTINLHKDSAKSLESRTQQILDDLYNLIVELPDA